MHRNFKMDLDVRATTLFLLIQTLATLVISVAFVGCSLQTALSVACGSLIVLAGSLYFVIRFKSTLTHSPSAFLGNFYRSIITRFVLMGALLVIALFTHKLTAWAMIVGFVLTLFIAAFTPLLIQTYGTSRRFA